MTTCPSCGADSDKIFRCSECGRDLVDIDDDDDDRTAALAMTDGSGVSSDGTEYCLYALTLGCPNCDDAFQVVEVTDDPVPIDMDVPLSGYPHCPKCGVHLPSIGEEWDVRSEHEIETVLPTQERDRDV